MSDLNAVSDQDPASIAAYYDKWAVGTYNDDLASYEYKAPQIGAGLLKKHMAKSDDMTDTSMTTKILDVGCGTGLSGEAMSKEGFTNGGSTIVGTDISEASFGVAAKTGVYESMKQHNLHNLPLPFEKDAFDGLFCVGVLTYVKHYQELLQDFSRIVKKGGVLVFTQRTHHYTKFGFDKAMEELVKEGVLEILDQSEPMPYLPGHKDFTDKILVYYFACRVN